MSRSRPLSDGQLEDAINERTTLLQRRLDTRAEWTDDLVAVRAELRVLIRAQMFRRMKEEEARRYPRYVTLPLRTSSDRELEG